MTKAINYLKNDHRMMLLLLQRSKSNRLTIDQRSAYLITVQSILTDHLKYEDSNLYPKLRELATADNNAIATVQEFTSGLEAVGSIISGFFDKNKNDHEHLPNNSDFNKIIKLLEVRIEKEESELYPLYEKLVKE